MVLDSLLHIYFLRSCTDERNYGQAADAFRTLLVLQMGNPKEWFQTCAGDPAKHSNVHAGRHTASHDYEKTSF